MPSNDSGRLTCALSVNRLATHTRLRCIYSVVSRRTKIIILISIVALLSLVFLIVRRAGKNEINQYKAELKAKGEWLSFADLPPPSHTNGNPNLGKLTNAVAKLRFSGMNPAMLMTMRFIKPGQASVAWDAENVVDFKSGTNSWQEFVQNLADNEPMLKKIRESVEHPETDTGWARTNLTDPASNTFVPRRTAAQWLAAATIGALHENQFPSALENLHALFQLAQVQKDDINLVNQIIRVAIVGLATYVTWEALHSPGWTEPQLVQLEADLNSVNLLDALEKGLVGDRIGCIEQFQTVRGYSTNKSGLWVTGIRTIFKNDELFYLKATQQQLEHLRLVRQGKPWPEVKRLLETDTLHREEINKSFRKYLHMLSRIAILKAESAGRRSIVNETQRQMALAAVALKRFELRNRKQAPHIEALVPEFLPMLPHDWMDQKPLKYRTNENGGFLLYSVGEDGRDDGGDPQPAQPLGKKDYELWSGRDAVWPVGISPQTNRW